MEEQQNARVYMRAVFVTTWNTCRVYDNVSLLNATPSRDTSRKSSLDTSVIVSYLSIHLNLGQVFNLQVTPPIYPLTFS